MGRPLGFNLIDVNAEVVLSVALLAPVVLAAAELYDGDLVALDFAIDRSRDFRAFDIGGSDGDFATVCNQQHFVQGQLLCILIHVLKLQVEAGAFFDAVLMGTIFDDCVHVEAPMFRDDEVRSAKGLQL